MKLRGWQVGRLVVVRLDVLVHILAAGFRRNTGAIGLRNLVFSRFSIHTAIPIPAAQAQPALHRVAPAKVGGDGKAHITHHEQEGQRYGQDFFHSWQKYLFVLKDELHNTNRVLQDFVFEFVTGQLVFYALRPFVFMLKNTPKRLITVENYFFVPPSTIPLIDSPSSQTQNAWPSVSAATLGKRPVPRFFGSWLPGGRNHTSP